MKALLLHADVFLSCSRERAVESCFADYVFCTRFPGGSALVLGDDDPTQSGFAKLAKLHVANFLQN